MSLTMPFMQQVKRQMSLGDISSCSALSLAPTKLLIYRHNQMKMPALHATACAQMPHVLMCATSGRKEVAEGALPSKACTS